MNKIENENKVEKSLRNSKLFKDALARAQAGSYDKELDEARADGSLQGTSTRLPLLKVTEVFSIRKHFSLAEGKNYFKLYKEKFYIENPGSNYFDTVNATVYRSVVAQREEGDAKWAAAVGAHLGIEVEDQSKTEAVKEAPKKRGRPPKKTTA